ncbi:uncharacterized protein TNCV_1091701 [Trichonephila clavipes]|nr:uncharacterized protein TNCV_1091701 [Trichonephila clavipes]
MHIAQRKWTAFKKIPRAEALIFDAWNSLPECYIEMKKRAYGVLTIFRSTYSWEQVFFCMNVRNPQTANKLLEVLAKFEERYSCKATLGSRNSDNVEGRGWKKRRMSNVGNNRGNWRNSEVMRRLTNGRNDYTVKKSRTQVITAQEAKCQNIGVVGLNIRIREFEKPWLIHVMADLEYPCIVGIDFIGESKIILDFDRKSLAIPDSQNDKVVKTAEEEKVEIDFSKTKLEEK